MDTGVLLECSADELDDAITRFEAGLCAVHQATLELIAAFEEKGHFARDGATSMAAWLSHRFGWSSYRAHAEVRVARALAHLPLIRDAYACGQLSFESVEALCRQATPDTEAELLDHALVLPVSELKRLLAGMKPVEEVDANRAYESRFLRYRWDEDSRVLHLKGMLADVEGNLVAKALEHLTTGRGNQLGRPGSPGTDGRGGGGSPGSNSGAGSRGLDSGAGSPGTDCSGSAQSGNQTELAEPAGLLVTDPRPRPSFEQSCADALAQLASNYLKDQADAVRATVVVHVDVDRLTDQRGMIATGIAALDDGPMIAGETALRLACDCNSELVIDGPDRVPIGIGRRSRQIPGWLYRVLKDRDHTCRFPGCDRARWTQHHHIRHWTQNGATDTDNLVTLCWFHHRLVHEGGWRVKGDANVWLDFIDPSGNVLTSLPPPSINRQLKDELLSLFAEDATEPHLGPPPGMGAPAGTEPYSGTPPGATNIRDPDNATGNHSWSQPSANVVTWMSAYES